MSKYEGKLYLTLTDYPKDNDLLCFSSHPLYIYFGMVDELQKIINDNKKIIQNHNLEISFRNKLFNYYEIEKSNARIEIGSIIREGVDLSDKAIVLMGAVINTNSVIGDYTMIDMNAVVGSGTVIGSYCHIGAGAVIAGVMEPISNLPVIIEDNVFVGANATILAGVRIKKNAIIGAGSVVTKDVLENTTVAGIPARVINNDQEWKINHKLR